MQATPDHRIDSRHGARQPSLRAELSTAPLAGSPSFVPLPVSLIVPGENVAVGLSQVAVDHDEVRGLLWLDSAALVLECTAARSSVRVGLAGVETRRGPSSWRQLVVPLHGLGSVHLRRANWWPWSTLVLVLRARNLRALAGLPGGDSGEVVLTVAQRDRSRARALTSEIELALAEYALHDAERTVSRELAAADAGATSARLHAAEWNTRTTTPEVSADIDVVMARVAARLRPACETLTPEEFDRMVEDVVLESVRYAVAWTEAHTVR